MPDRVSMKCVGEKGENVSLLVLIGSYLFCIEKVL